MLSKSVSFALTYCWPILMMTQWKISNGLVCYSCNTESPSADCIDNPEKYTNVLCGVDEEGLSKDYCYTTRLEQNNAETGELEITLDRSCCRPHDGSSACPTGSDFQIVQNDQYTKYFTRCKGDFCNSGNGDDSDDANNGGMLFCETLINKEKFYVC